MGLSGSKMEKSQETTAAVDKVGTATSENAANTVSSPDRIVSPDTSLAKTNVLESLPPIDDDDDVSAGFKKKFRDIIGIFSNTYCYAFDSNNFVCKIVDTHNSVCTSELKLSKAIQRKFSSVFQSTYQWKIHLKFLNNSRHGFETLSSTFCLTKCAL